MKNISQFSTLEWLKLKPLTFLFKQFRNDFVLFFYQKIKAQDEDVFLEKLASWRNQKVLIVIAFEQPKILNWVFSLSQKNLKDFKLVVFDNSKKSELRIAIKEICDKYEVPYLGLPFNPTTHPNRSHGMAMTWIFNRIIKKIQPSWFGYLDHDMIPVAPVDPIENIGQQEIYGTQNPGYDCWNLWAGYCFFKYQSVKSLPLNFLYDFSRGLDTGGRNWDCLYSQFPKEAIVFADDSRIELKINDQLKSIVQVIDGSWIHIGGVSYNNNLAPKEIFFENLIQTFQQGITINDLKSHYSI